MVIALESDREAKLLATRLVSVKHIWELWAHGDTYDEVHSNAKSDAARALWASSSPSLMLLAKLVLS